MEGDIGEGVTFLIQCLRKTLRSGPDSVHLVEGLDLQVEKTDTSLKVYVVGRGKGVECAD